MSKFKNEIDWYWSKRVYVYPFKSVTSNFNWLEWRNLKDSEYKSRLQNYYEIDAIGLNLVCGKKGICGIGIRRDNNDKHSLSVLYTVLSYLNLPREYPWVIQTPHENIIVLDVQDGFNNKDEKVFKDLRIIWETFIQLPIRRTQQSYSVDFFKFNPQGHPIQRKKEDIYKCIDKLKKKDIILLSTKPWWKRLFNL